MSSAEHEPNHSAPRWLLLAGATAGIALAAFGLYELEGSEPLPESAVARVNGRDLALADYRQLRLALEQDKRDRLEEEDRDWILERMIEEELLVQRALEIGLLESDPSLRQAAVRAMMATITADAAAAEPDERELQAFFERERDRFRPQARLHVRRVRFAGDDAHARAEQARRALEAGTPIDAVQATADRDLAAPPDGLLPPSKLIEYLGPATMERIAGLGPGETTGVLESGGDLYVVQLVAREASPPVELSDVRDEVAAEWRRQRVDAAFRRYLDDLQRRAAVERREALP